MIPGGSVQPHPPVIAQQTSWDDGHVVPVHNLGSEALVLPLQPVDLPRTSC